MKAACGHVFKYGDNVDTDVIIPARYLNSSDPKELATHCMEDIDKDFVENVKEGDIIVANKNFGCGSSRELHRSQLKRQRKLCHCRDICENFLPECDQHRIADHRVPGCGKRD